MLETDTFVLNPIQTPGLVHAANLTEESAKVTEDLLKENKEKYHIHITVEDQTGVSLPEISIHRANLGQGIFSQPHRSS